MVVEQLWQSVPGGSGTYISNLARALVNDTVPLVGLTARHRGGCDDDIDLPSIPLRQFPLPRPLLYETWNRWQWPSVESILRDSDVVHATTWAIPPTRCPMVVTIHDLAFLRSPEHFTRRGAAFFRRALERTFTSASGVIVPSRVTADDCIEAGIGSERITVIPHGVDTQHVTSSQQEEFRHIFGLTRPFIMWAGTREPRKNLPMVLKAFTQLCEDRSFDLDLVLVGPAGWGPDDAIGELSSLIPPDRLHVLGRLSDECLAVAYQMAEVFVFPSLWEGFGLPVLEAMAYGTPVVTSAGTSMEEVCGEAGVLIDPHDARSLAEGIRQARAEKLDRASAGLKRAQMFTWQECARAHEQVYASVGVA